MGKQFGKIKLGPPSTNGKSGAQEVVTCPLGRLTLMVRGVPTPDVDWRPVVVHNNQVRIGRSLEAVGTLARVSLELWDKHHARWANRRQFSMSQLIGLVRGDDPGLSDYGVPLAPLKAVAPSLIVVGGAP
jgi:hypothetical protein